MLEPVGIHPLYRPDTQQRHTHTRRWSTRVRTMRVHMRGLCRSVPGCHLMVRVNTHTSVLYLNEHGSHRGCCANRVWLQCWAGNAYGGRLVCPWQPRCRHGCPEDPLSVQVTCVYLFTNPNAMSCRHAHVRRVSLKYNAHTHGEREPRMNQA